MKSVYTLTPDVLHKNISKKLTSKQWVVYYYLMSICDWNGRDKESHYFLYKNKLNISAAARILNMSRTTIHNAITKFQSEELNILQDRGDYYWVSIPTIFAAIHQETLKFLILFQKRLGIDLIRTYAILCRIKQHPELPQHFNKSTLLSIMGHSVHDTSMYCDLELYLAFLSYWGLIDVRIKTVDSEVGPYKDFYLVGISTLVETSNTIINFNEPVDDKLVDTLREEILKEGWWDTEKEN